jgi:hypothetical protein
MFNSNIQTELLKLLSKLNLYQKKVVITFINELLNANGNIVRQSIEEYNLELNQAIKNVKKGNYTSLEDLEIEMESW